MSSTVTAPRLVGSRLRAGPRRDIVIAAAVLAVSLLLVAHGGIALVRHGPGLELPRFRAGSLDLLGAVLVAASTVPVVAWRRRPLGVLAITGLASVLLAGLGYPLDVVIGPAVALYLTVAHGEPRERLVREAVVLAAGLFVAYLAAAAAAQRTFPGPELLHSGLAGAVAWFAGERTRLRREQIAELRARAQRAEQEAGRERLLAAAEERARIARDLHDSAGHAISVIAVRAGAARMRHAEDPGRSLQALEAIEELARQTADEIDHIVGGLRKGSRDAASTPLAEPSGPTSVEAPPGLASFDTLIARHAEAGLGVSSVTTGSRRPVGSAVDHALYRILQEALTNAARHGAGRAQVELAFGPGAVELTVTNPVSDPVPDLPGAVDGQARASGGHGLTGMQERAALLGGHVEAGCTDGTFRVHARIPDRDRLP